MTSRARSHPGRSSRARRQRRPGSSRESPFGLLDGHIVGADVAAGHEAVVVELPMLVPRSSEPFALGVVPLVFETNRYAVVGEGRSSFMRELPQHRLHPVGGCVAAAKRVPPMPTVQIRRPRSARPPRDRPHHHQRQLLPRHRGRSRLAVRATRRRIKWRRQSPWSDHDRLARAQRQSPIPGNRNITNRKHPGRHRTTDHHHDDGRPAHWQGPEGSADADRARGRVRTVGLKGRRPTNLAWYHNLVADPNITIQDGPEPFDVVARVVSGESGWSGGSGRSMCSRPSPRSQEKTDREIPVFVAGPTG